MKLGRHASPLGVRRYASPLGVRRYASPLGVRRYASPLGVPADLQSAAVGFSYLQIRDTAFSLEADCKSARK